MCHLYQYVSVANAFIALQDGKVLLSEMQIQVSNMIEAMHLHDSNASTVQI